MKKIFKDNENKIQFMIFVITIVVAIVPLITRYCINGHDLEYHLLRIESLKEGILIGKPFLKVNTLFFGNAGYASSLFYPDLFLHVPAVLRVLGVGIGASYHIFLIMMFIICYISTYYCTYKITSSKYTASLAAVLLTLCPYHMDDMLIRAACGEIVAFVFVPFVVYGMYNVIFEEMDKPYILAIGFAGLVLSHPATLVMNIVFAFALVIINIKVFIKNAGLMLKLVVTAITVLLVTAFQWLPMLEQMMTSQFYLSADEIDMLDGALQLYEVFSQSLFGCGVILAVLVIPRIFLNRDEYPILKYADMLIAGGFIYAVGATKILPWEHLERFLRFVQFPWRLIIMSSVLLSIADAIIIVIFVRKYVADRIEPVVCVLLAICATLSIIHFSNNQTGYYDYGKDYYSYEPFTANVIGGEWLPATVTDREAVVGNSHYMYGSDGSSIDFTRDKAVISAVIPEGLDCVSVPFIYYKGYKAVLAKEDGSKMTLPVSDEGINGMCLVSTMKQGGSLKVWYAGTAIQHISTIVSLATILLLVSLFIIKRNKKKLNDRGNTDLVLPATILFIIASSLVLGACSSEQLEDATKQIEAIDEAVKSANDPELRDPQKVIDYLKQQIEEDEETEVEEEISYVDYYYSRRGYEEDIPGYAVKVDRESGVAEYSIVDINDPALQIETEEGIKQDIAEEYAVEIGHLFEDVDLDSGKAPLEAEQLKEAIMYAADALLYLEIYPEGKYSRQITQLSGKLAELIYLSADKDSLDDSVKYNGCAVLIKTAYVLEGWMNEENAVELAKALWEMAENSNTDNDENLLISRAWAAAELYRYSEQGIYKSIVEQIAQETELDGFTYSNPGSYCRFTYLSTAANTNYELSSNMMTGLFEEINSKIKNDRAALLQESIDRIDADSEKLAGEYLDQLADDCRKAIMADHISINVEYIRYAQDRIIFLCGANPTGIDYLTEEYLNPDRSLIFVLCGINK